MGKDYSVRATGQGKDEVGVLVTTFNQMLDEIQKQNRELEQARRELEQRVEARTRELASANKELEASPIPSPTTCGRPCARSTDSARCSWPTTRLPWTTAAGTSWTASAPPPAACPSSSTTSSPWPGSDAKTSCAGKST